MERNQLGYCEKCHGDLCVRGKLVSCIRCGHDHPDHDILKNQPASEPPKAPVIPSHDFPATWNQRVMALEAKVAFIESLLGGEEGAEPLDVTQPVKRKPGRPKREPVT